MARFFKGNVFVLLLFIVLVYEAVSSGEFLSDPVGWLIQTALIIPGIIIGITCHEFAHAFAAYKLGDQTPKYQKRVTLNPIRHVDPIGFIALIFIGFGWGRPVEVDPYAFRHPRRSNFIVDIAGITTNFILAWVFMGIIKLLVSMPGIGVALYSEGAAYYTVQILSMAVYINIVLMIFNLLPVPPLDGFGIITEIFNLRTKSFYYQLYNAGFPILIVLIMFNIPAKVISPIIISIYNFIQNIFF